MINLDLLVAYTAQLATSANQNQPYPLKPFPANTPQENYNPAYAHFLDLCELQGVKAGFTTSSDVIAPGTCTSFWTRKDGQWQRVLKEGYATHIFDKIPPSTAQRRRERKLLLADKAVRPLNHRSLYQIFFDKLITYQTLPSHSIPTVALGTPQKPAIKTALQQLEHLKAVHPHPADFGTNYVLKDRYGAGGNYVYLIDQDPVTQICQLMHQHLDVQFILQAFLRFDTGFTYRDQQTATDIRFIFYQNQLLQCYLRLAQPDDFRCNEHQGGELIYVEPKTIPQKIRAVAQKLAQKLDKPHSIYALDLAVSNQGNVYCIEGNNGPGIDWDATKKVNERKSKQLIQSIVSEFATRIV